MKLILTQQEAAALMTPLLVAKENCLLELRRNKELMDHPSIRSEEAVANSVKLCQEHLDNRFSGLEKLQEAVASFIH